MSSSTPRFADATTAPVGSEIQGKQQDKKDLTAIMVAHGIPYVAQSTFIGNFRDLHEKAKKAIYTQGPCFLNVLSPCPRGWQYDTALLPTICQLAVDTCLWPMYEVENGVWRLTYEPKKKKPIEDYMRLQGRFKHCFQEGQRVDAGECPGVRGPEMGGAAGEVQMILNDTSEEKLWMADLHAKVAEAELQQQNGEEMDAREALSALREKYHV